MFTERGMPVTVYGVATAMQRNPEPVAAMKEAGWEIASHGLKWIEYKDFTRRRSAGTSMRRSASIRRSPASGPRLVHGPHLRATPIGSSSRRAASSIRRFLRRRAALLGQRPDGAHLIVPYTLDANDMRFATPQGFNSGDQFFAYLKDGFDLLYAEGGAGQPKMLSVGLHCRLVGRPGRAAALARFLDYIQRHDRVWVARRLDIARHWIDVHPATDFFGAKGP